MCSIPITSRTLQRALAMLPLVFLATLLLAEPSAMTVKFSPGTTMRYEFEGFVHVSTEHAAGMKLKGPADCTYPLKAVLQFDFTSLSAEGTLAGRIAYQGVEAQVPECAISSQERVTRALKELETSGAAFQIYAGDDVRLSGAGKDDPEVVTILRKAAWDLLQRQLTDADLAPGSDWRASRRFLYWPDSFVEGLDVAATSMHYAHDVKIAGSPWALLEYKQVFSPAEMPAYIETRSRANDFTGTTMVTGRASVSVLWSRAEQRVAYLHRQRSIDNRLTLRYDRSDADTAIARCVIQEESTLRWLPERNPQAWLAELHRFEASAGEAVPQIAQVRKPETKEQKKELSDLLNRPPRGFERWNKTFCSGAYCFELSLAVPEGTQVADSTGMTMLLLAGSGARTVMISVGPMFDLQCTCLTNEELLQQQTVRFIGNHLWFGRGTGESLNFSSASVHDRPAGFSEFSSKSRDLTPIRGQLVMVLGPYDQLAPVACAHDGDQPDLDSACQIVTQSVVIQ